MAAFRITSTDTLADNTPVNFPRGAGCPTEGVVLKVSPGRGVELANTSGTGVPATSPGCTAFFNQALTSFCTCFWSVAARAFASVLVTATTFVAPPPVVGSGFVTVRVLGVGGVTP